MSSLGSLGMGSDGDVVGDAGLVCEAATASITSGTKRPLRTMRKPDLQMAFDKRPIAKFASDGGMTHLEEAFTACGSTAAQRVDYGLIRM